jgi:hypothetical protein
LQVFFCKCLKHYIEAYPDALSGFREHVTIRASEASDPAWSESEPARAAG